MRSHPSVRKVWVRRDKVETRENQSWYYHQRHFTTTASATVLHQQKKTKEKEHTGPENQAEVMYSIQSVRHMQCEPHSAYM